MNIKPSSLFLFLVLGSCAFPEALKESREIRDRALRENLEIAQPKYLETEDFRLHYREVGHPELGIAVWIHGTPGSWDDGIRLMVDESFTSEVKLVGIDRPGWGESQVLTNPRLLPSFQDQSQFIAPLLLDLRRLYPNSPIILVGHSWGASVVPAIALDHPELVDGIVLAAGGLNPELTRPRWYNRMANTLFARQVLGEAMLGANAEVYALSEQLVDLAPRLAGIALPVVVIQGLDDGLVDPENAEFAREMFSNPRILELPGQGHLLQAEQYELIGRCIKSLMLNVPVLCDRE